VLRRHPRLHHLAGADAERAADLVAAWADPSTRAVIAARGGCGVHRFLDTLDWAALAAAGPKVLVGFSDVTALHEAFAQRLGLVTVHGPVACSLGEAPEVERAWLRGLLMDPEPVSWDGDDVLVAGSADGVLTGGNLAVLAAGLGTAESRPATGAVVALEEVGEEPYRIDRMLTHLLRTGWFDGVRGVVLGHFTRCGDPGQVRAVLSERLGGLGVPVLAGLPFGHQAPNLALPLGVRARLDTATRRLMLLDRPLR
ncbi:MAG: LD-carboxypeptidase, partial [Actinomycetota bacterium]|nr:LD-carboxypeptidase [Actinomycetota bacterium]